MKLLDTLQKLQNNCLKICYNKPKLYSTQTLHKECKMPLLEKRREAHIRNYSFKYSKKDIYLKKSVRHTRCSIAPILKISRPTCKAITNSIQHKCATAWNQLKSETRLIDNEKTFKKRTKQELLMTNT